ncbi:hypothetical protein PP707_05525, partial [Acetobacter pasteurianus]|nr:hypothetical protein [Acetobacter pasteurianus]
SAIKWTSNWQHPKRTQSQSLSEMQLQRQMQLQMQTFWFLSLLFFFFCALFSLLSDVEQKMSDLI